MGLVYGLSKTKVEIFIYFYNIACSLTDRPTDEIFVEEMLIYKRNVHRKNQTSILNRLNIRRKVFNGEEIILVKAPKLVFVFTNLKWNIEIVPNKLAR